MAKHLLILTVCTLLLTLSCEKLPENGKLDGWWQVTEVQFARNGAYDSIVPMKEQKIFWAVQLKLISITGISNGTTGETLCRFHYAGDRLQLTEMYVHHRDRDDRITDPAFSALKATGIDSNQADFAIEALDSKHMQLRSDFARIVFRKF